MLTLNSCTAESNHFAIAVTESAGVLLDAGPEYHLARALLQPAAPRHHPTAALPSMGDVPLAVHMLLSQARPKVGKDQWRLAALFRFVAPLARVLLSRYSVVKLHYYVNMTTELGLFLI